MNRVEEEWRQHFKPRIQEEEESTPVNLVDNTNIFAQTAIDLYEGIEAERGMDDDELEQYTREKPTRFEVTASASTTSSFRFFPTLLSNEDGTTTDTQVPNDDVYLEFTPNNNGPSSTGNASLSESFGNNDNSSSGTLEYWKKNEHRFPQLSKMAKKYLLFQAQVLLVNVASPAQAAW